MVYQVQKPMRVNPKGFAISEASCVLFTENGEIP